MGSKLTLLTIVAISFIVVSVSKAEEYTEYTKGTPTAPGETVTSSASNIGFDISFPSLSHTAVPGSTLLPGSYLNIDQNLDSSKTGTLYVNGGNLRLQDFTYTAPLAFFGNITYTTTGLTYSLQTGPLSVSNGSFGLNTSAPGSLSITGGTLRIQGTIATHLVDGTIDYNTNPLTIPLNVLTGYADADNSGTDNDTNPHVGNHAGLTPSAQSIRMELNYF